MANLALAYPLDDLVRSDRGDPWISRVPYTVGTWPVINGNFHWGESHWIPVNQSEESTIYQKATNLPKCCVPHLLEWQRLSSEVDRGSISCD